MLLQQGDVLLEKTEQISGKQLSHLILAEGESTGHCHTITQGDAILYCDEKGNLSLNVRSENAVLTHQEHKSITIPRGKYSIRKVLEYDHFLEEAKSVRD